MPNGMYILYARSHQSAGAAAFTACNGSGSALRFPSLAVVSGATTLMRMPSGPSSHAMAREKLVVAALAAA